MMKKGIPVFGTLLLASFILTDCGDANQEQKEKVSKDTLGSEDYSAPKIGQTKKGVFVYEGEGETQVPTYHFKELSTNETDTINSNQFIDENNCYQGIPINNLNAYKGQKLEMEFIYGYYLGNEGGPSYLMTGWIVTSIKKEGTQIAYQKTVLPLIGSVNDPAGYVTIRKEPDANSEKVGELEDDGGLFYFHLCSDPNWYIVYTYSYSDNQNRIAYVNKSGIKIKNY